MSSFRVVERTRDGDFIWATPSMPKNRAESIRRKMITGEQYEVELGHELHVEATSIHNDPERADGMSYGEAI